jgi:hypothetical protein
LEDDGSILWWDDNRQEWDVWEGKLSEPLPPPEFAKPEVLPYFRPGRTPLDIVLIASGVLFALSGAVWLVLQFYFAFTTESPGYYFGGDSSQTLTTIMSLAYTVWQLSVGAVIVAVALQARHYFATRAIVEGDRTPNER